MSISKGLSYAIDANPGMVSLIAACRGDRPVGEVRAEVSSLACRSAARAITAFAASSTGYTER